MASLVKRCGCGSLLPEDAAVCTNCGSDVSALRLVPEEAAPRSPSPAIKPTPEAPGTCPKCRAANDAIAMVCAACGTDLAPAIPATAPPRRLTMLAQGTPYPCRDDEILGREGTIARPFFAACGTVSRRHAILRRDGATWTVTIPPEPVNPTLLDGSKLPRGQPVPLTGEHTLRLSSFCEVLLRVEPADAGASPESPRSLP